MINQKLFSGQELSNQQVREIFGCSLRGGMNPSKKTNTLVLIFNKVKSIYLDRFDGDTIFCTGMGLKGDQELKRGNKVLAESNETGVNVHLFEIFEETKYTYAGEVILAGKPFQEIQPDQSNINRKVWMFPLRLKEGYEIQPIPEEKLKKLNEIRTKTISSLSDEIVLSRAKLSSKKQMGTRQAKTTQYQRNEYVSEFAKRRANGICQLCAEPAPFIKKNKEPYLEVHHIVWLAKGGEDTLENTVAICPNCHRRMHVLDSDEDKKKLLNKIGAN